MENKIIVNVDRRQTRVAILEDGRLAELAHERESDVVGNIYLGRVESVVAALDAAFVDCGIEKNVFLHVSDALVEEPTRAQMRHKMESLPPIKSVVKKGEEFLVQVTKAPLEAKGARATRRISLPGRYLVLMADGRGKVGVSKKIEDDKERERLRRLAEKLKPEGFGIIVRTNAEGAGRAELEADIKFLMRLWRSIQGRARQVKAPALVHEDLSLVFEVVRDVFSSQTTEFVIDDKVTYDKVLNIVDHVARRLRNRIKLYKGPEPIFDHYEITPQIERALRPKVWLPHGGWINIEQTEALTAIDVNTGKFTGSGSLEETVLRTNLEACDEIARQLRLRRIGGIIVIDFIDMDKQRHRTQVTTALRKAFANDRMRTRIMHITPLGLVEMTRKRTGQSLAQQLQTECPYCNGHGRVLAPETVAFRVIADLRARVSEAEEPAYAVVAAPSTTLALIGPHGEEAAALEEELGVQLFIRANEHFHPERYEITADNVRALRRRLVTYRVGSKLTIQPEQVLRVPQAGLVACVGGYIVEVPDASPDSEQPTRVRLTRVDRSYGVGVVI